jgi:hypothetical protein
MCECGVYESKGDIANRVGGGPQHFGTAHEQRLLLARKYYNFPSIYVPVEKTEHVVAAAWEGPVYEMRIYPSNDPIETGLCVQ